MFLVEAVGSECAFLSLTLTYILLFPCTIIHYILCLIASTYSLHFVIFTFFVEKSWMILLYIY